MDYSEYLKSEHWQKLRVIALGRAKFCCQVCNAANCQLDVQHRTYERLGRERLEDLTVLCRQCHERHHKFDELVQKEIDSAMYLYEMAHCFDYSGLGTCRRCGLNATQNFGSSNNLQLACDIGCDIKINYEEYRTERISESPHRTCENCHDIARLKFRISNWECEDAFTEHFACGETCRDSYTLKRDTWELSPEHKLDAGQFAGTELSKLPEWYLQCIDETVLANGSKIRRACIYETWSRQQNSNTKSLANRHNVG